MSGVPPFEVHVLGSGSATPVPWRNPSSHLLVYNQLRILIDCGEGTQMQLLRYGLKLGRIDHICITHLHGDHYFGLPGLLTAWHLTGRTKPLHLYAPAGLEELLQLIFSHSGGPMGYPLVFHQTSPHQVHEWEIEGQLLLKSLPIAHRIPTTGFLFSTLLEEKKASYAYISDTVYLPELARNLHGVDLLYHEATFTEELEHKAIATGHSTARQAALIAQASNASQLLIGHFSARYKDTFEHLEEAVAVFSATSVAEEGRCYRVRD